MRGRWRLPRRRSQPPETQPPVHAAEGCSRQRFAHGGRDPQAMPPGAPCQQPARCDAPCKLKLPGRPRRVHILQTDKCPSLRVGCSHKHTHPMWAESMCHAWMIAHGSVRLHTPRGLTNTPATVATLTPTLLRDCRCCSPNALALPVHERHTQHLQRRDEAGSAFRTRLPATQGAGTVGGVSARRASQRVRAARTRRVASWGRPVARKPLHPV